jgi:hypothetical protein
VKIFALEELPKLPFGRFIAKPFLDFQLVFCYHFVPITGVGW